MLSNGSRTKLQKAKISLDDCLACSGCVTSAETVLIGQQSSNELLKVMEKNRHFLSVYFHYLNFEHLP